MKQRRTSGAADGFSWVIASFDCLKSNTSVSVPVVPVIAASKWANWSSILPLSSAFRRSGAERLRRELQWSTAR